MYLPLILGVLFVLNVHAGYDKDKTVDSAKEDHNYYYSNPWRPAIGPYGDRLKPIKKDPKEDKFYYQSGIYTSPYLPLPYVTGLYTSPYGYEAPLYQPAPYPAFYNNYIKDHKEKYTPTYKNK